MMLTCSAGPSYACAGDVDLFATKGAEPSHARAYDVELPAGAGRGGPDIVPFTAAVDRAGAHASERKSPRGAFHTRKCVVVRG